MSEEDLIRMFPSKRISPFDGMAVTAEVWEMAHETQRQRQQLAALFRHGPGILVGLDVIASDPPDSTVYVLPGVAMDPLGQIIVLREPVAYDVGQAHGRLYLLLTYGESRPRAEGDREGGPLYVHDEYGLEASLELPESAHVELARFRRASRDAPLSDADDATHPGANEIDLRYRREIGQAPREALSIGVVYVGGPPSQHHRRGADRMARASRACVDHNVPLAPGLGAYTLLYLVGCGLFELSADEMKALYAYLQEGGTVLIESCRRDTEGEPPSDAAFADLLGSLGVQLEPLPADHRLLSEPFLFATPPVGYESEGEPAISIGGGVVLSAYDYGCLWQGERRSGVPSREEIRAALEWGTNVIAYAASRSAEARR